MSPRGLLAKDFEAYQGDPDFELEVLLLEINGKLLKLMDAQRMSRAQLASRLGVSRAFVTKLLNGNENLTARTLVRVASALDAKLSIDVRPAQEKLAPNYLHTFRLVPTMHHGGSSADLASTATAA